MEKITINLINKKAKTMKIPAIVIWYNPDNENIKNIRTYIDYVEKLYIIDNSKENNKDLENSITLYKML